MEVERKVRGINRGKDKKKIETNMLRWKNRWDASRKRENWGCIGRTGNEEERKRAKRKLRLWKTAGK